MSFDYSKHQHAQVLASKVRTAMHQARTRGRPITPSDGFNYSTTRLINKYLEGKEQMLYPEGKDVFPINLI